MIPLPPNCKPIFFLFLCLAAVTCSSDTAAARYGSSLDNITSLASVSRNILVLCRQFLSRTFPARIGAWEIMHLIGICATLPALLYIRKKFREASKPAQWQSPSYETMEKGKKGPNDSLLLRHSEFRNFTTSRFTYESVRVFYRRHPQADKLPTRPSPLPLLLFIHGLGGSATQFSPLLTSLVNSAPCLCIDLPGCGLSKFSPKSWEAYTIEALAELIEEVIEHYREREQSVVLIAHSMGCSLAALLASTTSTLKKKLQNVVGVVAICPRADPPTKEQVATFRKLLLIPGPIFDLWRRWDRRGGSESASVRRFVGEDADMMTKELQVRFNSESRTPVWRRMASGILPSFKRGIAEGGLPGRDVWAGLEVPIFLVAGEADKITKPGEIEKIASFLGKSHPLQIEVDGISQAIVDSAAPVDVSRWPQVPEENASSVSQDQASENPFNADSETALQEDPSTPTEEQSSIPFQPTKPRKVLKTTVLPAPAGHALLYTPATARTLAGLVSDFLCSQVTPRLSLGWQLQFLSTSGKWDVKNLNKWKGVDPVSEPIAGIFRAMKTLREVDETHCPEVFVKQWGHQIKDIVDISHDQPVYDPFAVEKGGIRYHKFPTVSKIPPTSNEVKEFIALIDAAREEQKVRAAEEGWAEEHYIGVHCHYGFNRTGYFIVCYLVERCGYSVQAAVEMFGKRRPKGIRHTHFLDQLYVRYCVGLKRAPTLI